MRINTSIALLILAMLGPSHCARAAETLRCASDGVTLSARDRDGIVAAVRRLSRFPVAKIETIDPDEHAPPGVFAALNLGRTDHP